MIIVTAVKRTGDDGDDQNEEENEDDEKSIKTNGGQYYCEASARAVLTVEGFMYEKDGIKGCMHATQEMIMIRRIRL